VEENEIDEILNEEDISSKKRRKKKEKKEKRFSEPWEKKERIIVFLFLFTTVFVSASLGISARKYKLPGLPEFKKPQINLESTIILENEKLQTEDIQNLKKDFIEKTKDLSGVYAFYVYNFSDRFEYGVNENKIMQAASLIKLPVIFSAFYEADNGRFNLREKYILEDSDKIGGSGSLSSKIAGSEYTLRELLFLMGNESDNTSFGVIRNMLSDNTINLIINKIGLKNTSLDENLTTPYEIGLVLKKIWEANLISEDAKESIIESLTNTWYEDHLPKGIDKDVVVAHKYGREVHVVNDAGIILYENNPFILVIMTDGVVEREADAIFPQLVNLIYEFEKNR